MKYLRQSLRGFSLAVAAVCMAGCVADGYTGPAITLTGGYQGFTFGVTLPGRLPRQPSPVEEAAAILSIRGLPATDAKQPIFP
jgi:hypothetical protein